MPLEIICIRSDEGLTLETSAFQIFHGGNFTFINSFDKTKFLFAYSPCSYFNSKVKKLEEATNYMWPRLTSPVHLWDVKTPIVFVSIR